MSKIDYIKIFEDQIYSGKEIPLNKWMQTDLTDHMKSTIQNFLGNSRILCSIPILKTELLVIEIAVKRITRNQSDFSDIIHRAMPYPILLIQNYEDVWYKVSIVSSHENVNNYCREVVDRRSSSCWCQSSDCSVLLRAIVDYISAESSREDLFIDINCIIHSFNESHKRYGGYRPEFDDIVNDYQYLCETEQITMLDRLCMVHKMFVCVNDEWNEIVAESPDDEIESNYMHFTSLALFLEQYEEVIGELSAEIKDIDDETIRYDYLVNKAAVQMSENLNGYCFDLESNKLKSTENEQTAISFLQELIEEMDNYNESDVVRFPQEDDDWGDSF